MKDSERRREGSPPSSSTTKGTRTMHAIPLAIVYLVMLYCVATVRD